MRTGVQLKPVRVSGIFLCLCLLVTSSTAIAQDADNADSRQPTRQTGTIEALQQDAGFIVISGQRYRVTDGRTRVYLDERELRLHHLDNGMVIAYTTDGSGTLLRVDLLGPADRIRELERS